jgi:hypothetical protein
MRFKRHLSGWKRTQGDLWMPVTSLGALGEVSTKGNVDRQLLAMFVLFNTIIVRDGLDPQSVHREFLKIDEYRRYISHDSPGADASLSEADWKRFKREHPMEPSQCEQVLQSTIQDVLTLTAEVQRETDRLSHALQRRD